MIRLAADENFDNDIIWGLLRRRPDLDIVRVQDVGLAGASDPDVLEWAAQEGRVILTHDKKTFVPYANQRVAAGQPLPGVCMVQSTAPVGVAINDILLLLAGTAEEEWEGQVWYVPF
jgi:hypothetical protein